MSALALHQEQGNIEMVGNIPDITCKLIVDKQHLFIFLLVICLLLWTNYSSAVTYKITFTGTWNASDVTGTFPSNAHLTQLVGATHVAGQPLWQASGLATLGIENVAEIGDPTVLQDDISMAIMAGTAATSLFISDDITSFPGSEVTTFEALDSHPYVTAISMIAPSPDWFLGVYDLSLKSGGNWITDFTVDLTPWDAGTEEGNQFKLRNPASIPHIPIAAPTDSPFVGLPIIGTLHFELIAPNGDINENGDVDAGDLVLAIRFLHGLAIPTQQQLARADLMPLDSMGDPSPNGQVTLADVLRINQLLLGM